MSNSAAFGDVTSIETNMNLGVTVRRRHVGDQFQDDLALQTLEALLVQLGPKGKEVGAAIDAAEPLSLAMVTLRVLRLQESLGTIYANPQFIVTANNDSAEFYRQVNSC